MEPHHGTGGGEGGHHAERGHRDADGACAPPDAAGAWGGVGALQQRSPGCWSVEPAGLLDRLPAGTAVIDAGNYVPQLRDGHIEPIDAGLTESQWVQSQLHHPVVKAFNTIRPASLASLGKPVGAAGRTAIPVAGDDQAAKAVVLRLTDQLGFDGLDAGPLAESWRQQPGTPVYTANLSLGAARRALADAAPEQTAAWRRSRPN